MTGDDACHRVPVGVTPRRVVRARQRNRDVVCVWSAGCPPQPVDDENLL